MAARGPLFGSERRRNTVVFGTGIGTLSGPVVTMTLLSGAGTASSISVAEAGGFEVGR
jgi:hypothetical protein